MKCKIFLLIFISIILSSCVNGGDIAEKSKEQINKIEESTLDKANEEAHTSSIKSENNTIKEEVTTKPSTKDDALSEDTIESSDIDTENIEDKNRREDILEESASESEKKEVNQELSSGDEGLVSAEIERLKDDELGENKSESNLTESAEDGSSELVEESELDKRIKSIVNKEDIASAIIVDDVELFLHDISDENIMSFIELDFVPAAINKVRPLILGSKSDSVFIYDIRQNTKKEIFLWENTQLIKAAWNNDGSVVVFNIHYIDEEKYVSYAYDIENETLTAISMGKVSDYAFSVDSKYLLIAEKNFKKSTGKYEFNLKKCELLTVLKSIYKVQGNKGQISIINNELTADDDKTYLLLKVYDEENITNAYIYDYDLDEMQTIISFSDMYKLYMDRYSLDNNIKSVYAQLGKWVFPDIVFSEADNAAYINDGISYFYYPNGSINGESEIGKYDLIQPVEWMDELLQRGE